jgi:hypothetical protein
MQNINYMGEGTQVLGGKDGIVIRKHIAGIEAGRALDCTDYPDEIIPAGLPVITDGNGNYKPLKPNVTTTEGVTTTTYNKPQGYNYCGLVEATITKKKAAAILTAGVVNEVACPYEITAEIKAALPHIMFVKEEAADVPTT